MVKYTFLETLVAFYRREFILKEEVFFIVTHYMYLKKSYVEASEVKKNHFPHVNRYFLFFI
jgi:hypothetical protein